MQISLKGKVAAITGGSEGIGRATALRMGELGATIALCARRPEVLKKTALEIRKLGVDVLTVVVRRGQLRHRYLYPCGWRPVGCPIVSFTALN